MASVDSKFDDLSDEKIDLVIDDTIPTKQLLRESLVRYRNFSFVVSELVQVNPDNSLAVCVKV